MKPKNGAVFITTLLALMALSPLDIVGAINNSLEIQGDDVHGSVGPHTTLCEFTNPSDCAEDHFDSGTSAHIGDYEYSGSDDPWAIYEVVLNEKPDCVGEDDLRFVLKYQVNDVYHRSGYSDRDVFLKLRDYGTSSGWDLLDSTVDTSSSSSSGDYAYSGTLDFGTRQGSSGNADYYEWGHGYDLVTDTTRTFSKNSISGTDQTGSYLDAYGTQDSKISLYIFTNPGSSAGNRQTRVEVDWIKVQYEDEDTAPTNPYSPQFYWEDSTLPGGPTTSGWYNSLGSKVEVRFGSGGSDACHFSNIEYMWLDLGSNPPSHTQGAVIYPDDTANSIYSEVSVPTDSGLFRFWYRAVDGLGNKAPWVSTDSIDFDYSDPQLPIIPEDSTWYNETDYIALTWLPASDTFSGMSKYNITQKGVGRIGFVDHEAEIEQYTFPIGDTITLQPGVNVFQITATDGTEPSPNSETKNMEIQYDPYPPVVNPPIVEPAIFTVSRPVVEWSHPLAYENPINGSGVFSCQLTIDRIEVSNIPVSECTNDSGLVTLAPLQDGPHSLTITACDFARNCGMGAFRNFTIDATPPSISGYFINCQDGWCDLNSVRVTANFSDSSVTGEGSGIDRVWHGFYGEGETPSISELKEKYPAASICEGICESHELNRNFPLPDGTWVWHYVVKDEAGSESYGYSSSITKIDTSKPYFLDGPSLTLSSAGILEASWEAYDQHSGINGYLFQKDSCDFELSTRTLDTSYSFVPETDSHFICVRAYNNAGLWIEEIIDSEDPDIECPIFSNDVDFIRQPSTITCYLYDDSTINLHDGLGSVESVLLDGNELISSLSYSSEVNEFSFDVWSMEIGPHHLQINALDRYGREGQYRVDYSINGEGIKIEFVDGSFLSSEASLSFNWDKDDLDTFFGDQLRVSGVNIDTLEEESLKEYFDVNTYRYDDPLDNVVILDFKPSVIPKIGESTTFTFTIDDTYNSKDFILHVTVEPCPPSHHHNSTSDNCEKVPTSEKVASFDENRLFLPLIILLAIMSGVLFRIRRGEK